ncbi:MAG: baseplate J/gp47 family protein, partial [Patescibacteria group bacterium]
GIHSLPIWIGAAVFILLIFAYLFLQSAHVKIFIEPQVLEKDAEVTADPKVKSVLEDVKIIPGQIVETQVQGSGKGDATGKKEIGDPAKGTVVIYNKTFDSKTLSKGSVLTATNGIKFSLDTSVGIASQSATEAGITYGKTNATVTAQIVGADGNLPSGTDLSVSNVQSSQISAKAEGNFSGGTSKQVTVVSDDDQNRLLAQVAAQLRQQAQQKLQESLKDKKILQEALSEEIVKKSFSKKINDQATDFSLNLTLQYKGTAFEDKDLKIIVSKLVNTQVPEGFELNLAETETQADVSKLEKDGKLIFLARFRAKLSPKLDLEKIKGEIKGKTPSDVAQTLRRHEHILGSEVTMNPKLPSFLQRLPFLERNITVEVGLK